jgi:hypothetical protein
MLGERDGLASIASVADAETLAPSCPQTSYGADGNVGPLFCVIDNPVAVRYFAPMAKRTFALGRDATPGQVSEALIADFRRQKMGLPMLCSVYQLAAWRNHWRFGGSIDFEVSQRLNVVSGWCGEPELRAVEQIEH